MSRCEAFWNMAKFNSGSWFLALSLLGLAWATVIEDYDWNYLAYPNTMDMIIKHAMFAGPAALLAIMAFLNPIMLNPYVLGWPFLRKGKAKKEPKKKRVLKKDPLGRPMHLQAFMDRAEQLHSEIERVEDKPDVELGSLATREVVGRSYSGRSSAGGPSQLNVQVRRTLARLNQETSEQYHDYGDNGSGGQTPRTALVRFTENGSARESQHQRQRRHDNQKGSI